jgi:hypothetical protein
MAGTAEPSLPLAEDPLAHLLADPGRATGRGSIGHAALSHIPSLSSAPITSYYRSGEATLDTASADRTLR